jgi:hypothetical protein
MNSRKDNLTHYSSSESEDEEVQIRGKVKAEGELKKVSSSEMIHSRWFISDQHFYADYVCSPLFQAFLLLPMHSDL